MVKHLKKMGGGGNGPVYPEGGSISVPLEECPICIDNDLEVPYLVKVRFLCPSLSFNKHFYHNGLDAMFNRQYHISVIKSIYISFK